jgi:hypothetical protein
MDAWFEQQYWEWTQRLPVENQSTQPKLFSYTWSHSVNFFITAKKLRTFWLLAKFCVLLYNIIFNTGVLHGQNVRH